MSEREKVLKITVGVICGLVGAEVMAAVSGTFAPWRMISDLDVAGRVADAVCLRFSPRRTSSVGVPSRGVDDRAGVDASRSEAMSVPSDRSSHNRATIFRSRRCSSNSKTTCFGSRSRRFAGPACGCDGAIAMWRRSRLSNWKRSRCLTTKPIEAAAGAPPATLRTRTTRASWSNFRSPSRWPPTAGPTGTPSCRPSTGSRRSRRTTRSSRSRPWSRSWTPRTLSSSKRPNSATRDRRRSPAHPPPVRRAGCWRSTRTYWRSTTSTRRRRSRGADARRRASRRRSADRLRSGTRFRTRPELGDQAREQRRHLHGLGIFGRRRRTAGRRRGCGGRLRRRRRAV